MLKKLIAILLLGASACYAEHSVLVYNVQTSTPVVEQNQYIIRPMASITKLMTAIVSSDTYNLSDKIKTGKKSTTTVDQLLQRLLVLSDNQAAEILARNHPEGRAKFIENMNVKARQLGLTYTHFNDPSGISADNVSTATELAKLVSVASYYPSVKQATATVDTNTNKTILSEFKDIIVSKTGFTTKAGRCLAMLVDKGGQQYAIIILGEPSKQVRDNVARGLLQTKYFYEQPNTETKIKSIIEQNFEATSGYYSRPASTWGIHPQYARR